MFASLFLSGLLAVLPAAATPWPTVKYHSRDFQTPLFNVTRHGSKPTADGLLFLGMVAERNDTTRGVMIVDDDGSLVWHGPRQHSSYYNFKTAMLNGKPVLTFWGGELYGSHGYGNVTIMDESYSNPRVICLPEAVNSDIATKEKYPPGKCFIDKHESYMTERNTMIVTTYNLTQTDLTSVGGSKDGWVYDSLFFELDLNDNNKVLFSWSALKAGIKPLDSHNFLKKKGNTFLGFSKKPVGSHDQPWDFFHINSVQSIDGGYLVNSRYTWSFYLVDGTTGAVNHTIQGCNGGDFTLPADGSVFFSWQHNPRVEKTVGDTLYIHLFNNDNVDVIVPLKNVSSGYYLAVNKTSKHVSNLRYVVAQKQRLFSNAEGSYQSLPDDHVLMGWGVNPIVQEFDAENKLIYAAQFGHINAAAVPHSYRAYRLPWAGTPTAPPDAVASMGADGRVSIYMSWNGATQPFVWNAFCGGPSNKVAAADFNITKTGFETTHTFAKGVVDCQSAYAEALSKDGHVIGRSATVAISGAGRSIPLGKSTVAMVLLSCVVAWVVGF